MGGPWVGQSGMGTIIVLLVLYDLSSLSALNQKLVFSQTLAQNFFSRKIPDFKHLTNSMI